MQIMKNLPTVALSLLLAIAAPTFAHAMDMTGSDEAATMAPTVTRAVVRKVDKSAQKITLKHEAIENLGMDGMTMVFHVKDAALLDKVKAGDQVRFTADKIKGAYTVLTIEVENK